MNNLIVKNVVRFYILALLQVLVFNHLEFYFQLVPFVYILYLIVLPYETPGWLILLSAFAMGLQIDLFSNTGGLHTASLLFAAFLLPWARRATRGNADIEGVTEPGLKNPGPGRFISLVFIITLSHHLTFFLLEDFRLSHFFSTVLHAILNTVYTMLFIVLIQYVVSSRDRKS